MQFSEFSLSKNLQKGIDDAGYSTCTEVQAETLTHTLAGKDAFVQSQTGTGKTAAFLISILELLEQGEGNEKALILAPTRELAAQIEAEARLLAVYQRCSTIAIYGGVSFDKQERALRDGVDIVIGTPGRLIDLANRRILNLHQFTYAVIDEADRMFDMGFLPDIRKILRQLPKPSLRQTLLFSATLSFTAKLLASEYMNDPVEVQVISENVTVSAIQQELYHVGSHEKLNILLGLLKKLQPERTLVFTNTKRMCEELAERLLMNGIEADFLTGDLAQNQRQKRINNFKSSNLPVLVATDVAARGIHVDNLELVVNYDIPQHAENYVHRVGRTARIGKTGTAITLACEIFVEHLSAVEAFIKMSIPVVIPEEELFAFDASKGKRVRIPRRGARPEPRRSRDSRGSSSSGRSTKYVKRQRPSKQRNEDRTRGRRSEKPLRLSKSRGQVQDVASVAVNSQPEHKRPVKKRKRGMLSKVISIFKR